MITRGHNSGKHPKPQYSRKGTNPNNGDRDKAGKEYAEYTESSGVEKKKKITNG